jgi:hypothetical protein
MDEAVRPYSGPRWLNPLFAAMAGGVMLIKVLSALMDNEVEWEDSATMPGKGEG